MSSVVTKPDGIVSLPQHIAPGARRTIGFDWTPELGTASIAGAGSAWAVSPLGPTIDNDGIVTGNKKTTAQLSGCTDGVIYTVTNTITTDETNAQIIPRSFMVTCGPR